MKAVSKILAGGAIAVAALASAAPAAAQYYPGYGYGYPNSGGNVVGQVLNQVLGGGQYGYGYGMNSQAAVDRCAAAVNQRIQRDYGGYAPYGGYGGYGGYGYNQAYAGGRVLGITRVEQRSNGRLRVRGVASSHAQAQVPYGGGYGGYGGYPQPGYGYAQPVPNLTFKCDIDYRGYISDVDLDRNNVAYNYTPYGYRGY